jgi:2-oxo-4-hydroxy-4-carboxy-5-ureidoimidazoline decarboxylase
MTTGDFNRLSEAAARQELMRCCGSAAWAKAMAAARPFADRAQALAAAAVYWSELAKEDHFEAFHHHPRIGEKQLREKFGATAQWAGQEQAGVRVATEDLLSALTEGNREYERRFGHIFLVCAAGKTAAEMLDLLRRRLSNEPAAEFDVACGEQAKITRLRLEKLLDA